jgi:thiamine kinase-like enzyme
MSQARTSGSSSALAATTRTCSASAAGVGVGAEVVAFLRPEGYLVTRFIPGTPMAELDVHAGATIERIADSIRRFHEGPAIPGLFIPLRICEVYRALADARGVRIPPEYALAQAIGRRIELALITNPLEMRPCHNDFLPGNLIDDGHRMRIVDWEYAGMGDPFFDLGNFSINNDLDAAEDTAFLATYDGDAQPRPDRLARLVLFRVISDFREAMWGVLQQGISTLDVDFRGYAAEHFDRLLANAATPRFERALREVTGV